MTVCIAVDDDEVGMESIVEEETPEMYLRESKPPVYTRAKSLVHPPQRLHVHSFAIDIDRLGNIHEQSKGRVSEASATRERETGRIDHIDTT